MKITGAGANTGCPHFLKEMQSCGLLSDGIYLPLRSHVVTYCLTKRHKKCPTYQQCCLADEEPERLPRSGKRRTEKSGNTDGRRRHPRIVERRDVLLRSCGPAGEENGLFVEETVTVDFSQGGMRVVLESAIPPGTSLLFIFGSDFLIPRLQGIAQLCWQQKTEGGVKSGEAGLVFKDSLSRAVLAAELGD